VKPDKKRRAVLFAAAIGVLVAPPAIYFSAAYGIRSQSDPLPVVRAYIEALYARDFERAYRHIARADQKIKAKEAYIQEKGPYTGFARELARRLAEDMEIGVIDRAQSPDRARITVRFKLPAPEDLSPLVYGWDSAKLDSLSPDQRRMLLETLEEKRKNGSLIMIESRQTFDLVDDGGEWRVFFDWAAGVRITFHASLSPASGIEARLSEREVIARVGEPFEINLKVKNHSPHPLLVRVAHLFEPKDIAERLELIMCGLLQPFELWPGRELEFSSAYLLESGIGEEIRQLAITYEFTLEERLGGRK
jgi:hypothetical protein